MKCNYLKEERTVYKIGFNLETKDKLIIENIKVNFDSLILTSKYEATVLEFVSLDLQDYEIKESNLGYVIYLYFYEGEEEDDCMSFYTAESYEPDLNKSLFTVSYNNKEYPITYIKSVGEILIRSACIHLADENADIINTFGRLIPGEIPARYIKDLLESVDTETVKSLAKIVSI